MEKSRYRIITEFICGPSLRRFCIRAALFFPVISCAQHAFADIRNVMYGIDVKPRANYTRLTFTLENDVKFGVADLPGNRLAITFPDTTVTRSRKLRSYSDSRIESISLRRRNCGSSVIVVLKGKDTGYRLIAPIRSSLVTLDVGPGLKERLRDPIQPGREKIWSGTEKLIREFEPPVRPDVPFIPSDGKMLRKLMPEQDVKLFLNGESAIYKEKPSEAEGIFRLFIGREAPVRTIAAFRLGEALYMTQKYPEALSLFRLSEKQDPGYLARNPSALFYYADCLARGGDLEAARGIMTRLIVGMSGTEHAPPLLVRLADMYRRAGRENEALSIYRNIAGGFRGTRAYNSARMRMYDRDFFSVNSVTSVALIGKYRGVNASASDPVLQDESLFKAALLEALYRPAGEAVDAVAGYEKKYPFGIFVNVAKAIHEDLLVELYHELKAANDCPRILDMVDRNRNYLAKCLAEQGFVTFISRCYADRGMNRQEMTLFMQLVDSEWAAASAPFIYSRILEDALVLGEKSLAEGAAREFLRKYPGDPLAGHVAERLGEICYLKGNMQDTATVLSRLAARGSSVEQPDSLYYLGKARERLHDRAGAEKAMALFVAELRKRGIDSRFQADAVMLMADARLAAGDKKGAMSLYRSGCVAARGEFRDALLYKMGDLERQQGNYDDARELWQKVVAEGSDSLWKKMAAEELADLQWRSKWKLGGK